MGKDYSNPAADAWFRRAIDCPAEFPFSFRYGEREISGFPESAFRYLDCSIAEEGPMLRCERTFLLEDRLRVTLKAAHNKKYGASEWTVWFENVSDGDALPVSDPHVCLTFQGKYPCLKGILGDHTNWYRPYAIDLGAIGAHFESNSGRATHVCFPYFNLEYGDGGAMLAIGWAGTWHIDFVYDEDSETTFCRAGSVNALNCALKPGEKIRTALFVRAPYTQRREDYATNYWRSWFVECNLPKADAQGRALEPFSTACLASDTGLPNSDGSISERHSTWKPSMEKMIAEGVTPDFRWFDAGWYIAPDGSSPESDWWGTVGTWTLDPVKWPGKSFLESTDYTRAHGMKTLMWFEPERVTDPDNLVRSWGYQDRWAIRTGTGNVISNNIGSEECLRWTLDRIKKTLTDNKVEMYREDNNSDQAALGRHLDALEGENRRGITECRFIDAHYRMWDEIIACTSGYGGCAFVDSCASGGGRNDLESLRRGIPLLRSDYDRTSTGIRLSMTTAFNRWVPFCGANNKEKKGQLDAKGLLDLYVWRASYLPVMNVDSQYAQDPDQDFEMLRAGLNEWKAIRKYLLKEFYVLTPWHTEEETTGFTAFAYWDPDSEDGILLAFRQERCDEDTLPLRLPFAEKGLQYRFTDADSGKQNTLDGVALLSMGLKLRFQEKREAKLIYIARRM